MKLLAIGSVRDDDDDDEVLIDAGTFLSSSRRGREKGRVCIEPGADSLLNPLKSYDQSRILIGNINLRWRVSSALRNKQ